MIRHISLMKFKQGTSKDTINELILGMGKLHKTHPEMLAFSWGKNQSKLGYDAGYTYCFEMDFETEQHIEKYLKTEEHKKASDAFIPYLEAGLKSVAVFDYELNK